MRTIIICGMLTLVLSYAFGSSISHAATCANDPFWQDTLRCQLFPTSQQTPPPKPRAPQAVDEIMDFTRVDLPWRNKDFEFVRCVDGTRPVIYVDKSVNGSDNWLFTFQGGGSCNDGKSCLQAYLSENEVTEMGTAGSPAMKNMQGIHRRQPRNAFVEYNRVRIEKCAYDRYNGTTKANGASASVASDLNGNSVDNEAINAVGSAGFDPLTHTVQEGASLRFDLFHHGKKTVLHTLDELRNGMTYKTWIDDGGVSQVQVSLPPLKNATKILFAGHSGGAHGLMHNIDDLVDYMGGWTRSDGAPFNADVRALFDAHLLPAMENEAAFSEHLGGDIYDHESLCRNDCKSGPPLHYTYDGMEYYSSGGVDVGDFYDGPYREWNVKLDASCLAAHPIDQWRCVDRFHVLFNHMTTPFFIREDFRDPNGQHNNNPGGPENHGHRLFWADPELRHCADDAATEPCQPVLSQAAFRVRVEEQAKQLELDFATRSELALGGGTIPTRYVWLPDCGEHSGAFDDHQFFNVRLDSNLQGTQTTMHDFMVDFMNPLVPGSYNARIDGDADTESICSSP